MEPLVSCVRAAQEGNAEVFNQIVERFQDMACASAYAMVGDVYLAEDVAQEAFLEAYLTLAKLREPAAFSSWFRRIILKQADRLTRGKGLTSSPLEVVADMPTDSPSPTEIAETNEIHARVHCAISMLPERERLVTVLFYGTGYALKDRQQLKDELIDVVRDVLREQRPSIPDTFPAKVHLLIAARLGDIDLVKELLARSPMLLNMKAERGEARDPRGPSVVVGLTALHEAAMHSHAQLVQLLCEYGANSNARTSAGLTPLHGAVLYHCHETAAVLLRHGANPGLALSSGLTALHLAAMKGDSEMVHLLLERGTPINGRSRYARTPLHWAALKGHAEIVQLLLAHGADCDARDATGRTPHDWALVREHTTIATLLLKKG